MNQYFDVDYNDYNTTFHRSNKWQAHGVFSSNIRSLIDDKELSTTEIVQWQRNQLQEFFEFVGSLKNRVPGVIANHIDEFQLLYEYHLPEWEEKFNTEKFRNLLLINLDYEEKDYRKLVPIIKSNLESSINPAYYAFFKNDLSYADFLFEHGINFNIFDSGSPLKFAIRQNMIEAINLLIRRGLDVNIRDDKGYTPLHIAVQDQSTNQVDLFLANKAEVNTVLFYNALTPLYSTILCKDVRIAERLLDHGAYINNPNISNLYAAIDTRSTPMVELLLSRGIDIEERRSGMSPEQYATSKGLSKISELIRTTKQNQQSYAISVG
jgi:ankyrin repeat protein